MKKQKHMQIYIQLVLQLILVFSLSAAVFLAVFQYDNKYTAQSPRGINGTLVLDARSLEAHPVTFLIDGWEYYGGRLLTPEDIKNTSPVPDQYIYIGQFGGFETWNDGSPHGCASYRLTIQLPETPAAYLLELPEIFSAYRLYVNGKPAAQMGEPEAENYRPETGNRVVSIEAGATTELLFAVSDYSQLYSGMVYPPAFGLPDAVSQLLNARLIFRSLICAAVVTIGLLAVMTGLLARRDTLALLFGLLCLAFVGYAGYPLFRTLPAGFQIPYLVERLSFVAMLCIAMRITMRTAGISWKHGLPFIIFGCLMCVFSVIVHLLLPLGHLDMMTVYSRLVSLYEWMAAIFIAAAVGLAIKKGTHHLNPLLYGAVILGCALIMDRLLPLHEPILTGWFIELASFALILCIGVVTGHEVASRYREYSVMQERADHMEQLYQSQVSYFRTIRQEMEQIKTMRHDLRHHLNIMDKYVSDGRYDQLASYIKEYHSTVRLNELPDYCPISVINILTHHYHTVAQQHGISLDIRCDLKGVSDPGYTKISDSDLCCLYSNLMENAVEACLRTECGSQAIRAAIFRIAPDILNIHVFNTAGQVQQADGRFLSSKQSGRTGYGLQSVENIVRKYNGTVDFSWKPDEKEFECRVRIEA